MDRSPPESQNPPPGGVELAPGVTAPPAALRMKFTRSGGPGGQNVNKLNTRAELWIAVEALEGLGDAARQRLRRQAGKRLTQADEIHLSAESRRTQEANRQLALLRLREMILRAQREPKPRRKTRPTAASRRRRLENKKRKAELKASRRPVEP